MKAKRKTILARIESLERSIARAQEYVESGQHAHWQAFRPLFTQKFRDGQELPPHKDWVRNVFIRQREKRLHEAEDLLKRLDRESHGKRLVRSPRREVQGAEPLPPL